ncbi:MAG: 2-hydroxyhepta-2,4-diene-1,7-dioate isomerase [Planctomycetota bacterium]|nr:MAG: 2-hydroxyhepta-2,4-diene-1,7-dioate isomerase [Planctomycetota bacterium]
MQLARIRQTDGQEAVGLVEGSSVAALALTPEFPTLTAILESTDPAATARSLLNKGTRYLGLDTTTLLAPIDQHEVWAAGVTYRRSQTARMEESQGAAVFYDQVYEAPRPELFFKATPGRVAGPGQPVRIRSDAQWNVPEPELAVVLNSRLEIVGYTIGNDMSSRDIEGENPLYLPQAKVYDACCGLGPWITLADAMPAREQMKIELVVQRGNAVVFQGETSAAQMARSFEDLVGWLGRDNSFPQGVVLLTGTGIVPPDDFTLAAGDEVRISIAGIGTLANPVEQRSTH